MECALSFGTTPSVRVVPGPEIWALRKVSTLESSFDTSACSGGETKKKKFLLVKTALNLGFYQLICLPI